VPLIQRNFTFLKNSGRICAFSVIVVLLQHTWADFLQLLIIRQNGGDSSTFADLIVLKGGGSKVSYKCRMNRKPRTVLNFDKIAQ
jgi:hypothetical protein